jgi:hypothetical protein
MWEGLMNSNEKKHYSQSYEDKDALDSAVLIMPLVFFMSAADPRFTSTLDTILKTWVASPIFVYFNWLSARRKEVWRPTIRFIGTTRPYPMMVLVVKRALSHFAHSGVSRLWQGPAFTTSHTWRKRECDVHTKSAANE